MSQNSLIKEKNRTFGIQVSIGGMAYSAVGYSSYDEANYQCYRMAYDDGVWFPRKLRSKWYQFWRPRFHNAIELRILNQIEGVA